MPLDFSEIAREWLLDPERIGTTMALTGPGRAATRDFGDLPLVARFAQRIEAKYPNSRLDDISSYVSDFLASYDTYASWWRAVLRENRIDMSFDNAEPRVSLDDISRWRAIGRSLDPDTLIALDFVDRFRTVPEPYDLRNWASQIVSDSHQIRQLFAHREIRIYDTHTHLEGCECLPHVWTRVIRGQLVRSDFFEFSLDNPLLGRDASRSTLGPYRVSAAVADAVTAFRDMLRDTPWLLAPHPPQSLRDLLPSNVSAELWPERRFLAAAWQHIIFGRPSPEFLERFDRYVTGKSLFLSYMTLGPGRNPGLVSFRRFFDRGKILPMKASARIRQERHHRLVHHALESPGLAGIELRIAPFRTESEYVRFFRHIERNEDEFIPCRRRVDGRPTIAFVVHFIRPWPAKGKFVSRPRSARPHESPGWYDAPAVEIEALQTRLDHETAVLHRFRSNHPRLARHIVGIDVANLERQSPVSLFSPYLRLLRGEHGRLDADFDDRVLRNSPALASWRELRSEGMLHARSTLPHLGLTYHAGEDFYHVLDGVKAIRDVTRYCGMREGDRIGHGLALGVDIGSFNRSHGTSAIMPQGEALDLLVWLHRRLGAYPAIDHRSLRLIEDDIEALCGAIYRRPYRPSELYGELVRRFHAPHDPARLFDAARDPDAVSGEGVETYWANLTDATVKRRRGRHRRIPASLLNPLNHPAFDWCQQDVVQLLIAKGIYLEVNPTSNVSILGLEDFDEHPIFRLLRNNDSLRFTISCDDPGTFATRLEVEYAMFRDSLSRHEREITERAGDLLERIARDSERSTFMTPPHRLPSDY